jgi:hypothetical protein
MWMDRHNNAVKTIITSISSHLTRLKETLHIDLYSRIFGYSMQVLVTRIMLFLKTRSKIGSAFDGHEVKRLKKDMEGIKSFFLDQVQFIDDRHTALVDDNQSSLQQNVDLLPFLSSSNHLRHHQLLTHGTSSGKWLAQSSLQTLNIMSDLITEKYDTTEFYCACEHIVNKYSAVSAKKMKLHHNNIVTSRTDHQYISELLLLTVVVALRTDSKDKLMSYLRDVILHQRGEGSHRNSGSDQIDSSGSEINQYKHDIIVRLFGSIETYSSINSSSSSNLINTTQINITTNETSSSNNTFIPEQQQQHSQHDPSKNEHINHNHHHHINFKHLISPVAAMGKHLRDVASDTVKKASDNMANNLSKSRYNEEKAMVLMRTIGLEVSRVSLYFIDQQHDHGDSNNNYQGNNNNNNNNNMGAAPINGNNSSNYITKQHKRPSSSSNSSTNLLSHRNSTSRNLLFDYEPVVATAAAAAENSRSKSSVDHTKIDTKKDGHKETKEDKDSRDSRNGKDGRVNRQSIDHHQIHHHHQMHQQLLLLQQSLPCWKKGDHIPVVAVRTSNDMRTSRIIGGDSSIDREGTVGSVYAIVIDDIQVKGLQSSALFDGPNPYIYFTMR